MDRTSRQSNGHIVPANPAHRTLFGSLFVVILAVGLFILVSAPTFLDALLIEFARGIEQKSEEDLAQDYRFLAVLATLTFALPLAFMGWIFLYQGYRVRESNQYPYPGMIILVDTPLETGLRARRKAKTFSRLGAFLFVSAGLVGWYFYSLLIRIFQSLFPA